MKGRNKMGKFKKNQYVVASNGWRFKGPQRITDVKENDDGINSYLTTNVWSCEVDLKEWIPNVGEYHLFYVKQASLGRTIVPTLGKLLSIDEDGWFIVYTDPYVDPTLYKKCIPFTGEIPYWLS